jgi:hypothetical protein
LDPDDLPPLLWWSVSSKLAEVGPVAEGCIMLVGSTLTDGGSREMVFFLPLLVVPGILGPTMDEVYLMISVSGGRRTPPRILAGSLPTITIQINNTCDFN